MCLFIYRLIYIRGKHDFKKLDKTTSIYLFS